MSRETLALLVAVLLGAVGVWAGYAAVAEPAFVAGRAGEGLLAITVAILGWGAILGGGRAVHRALARLGHPPDASPGSWLHAVVAGFVLLELLLGLLVFVGAFDATTVALLLGVLLLGVLLPGRMSIGPPTRFGPAVAVGAVLLLGPTLLLALAPPVGTDELFLHLAVPAELAREGTVGGGWLDPVASRPLALQLVYGALVVLGGSAGAKVFHALAGGLLLLGVVSVVRGTADAPPEQAIIGGAWAVALLAGSWTFLDELPLAHDNLPCALLVLAATAAALRGRLLELGLAAGAALSIKYTAAPAVGALFAWAAVRVLLEHRSARPLGAVVGAGLLALLVVSPWWIRNAVEGLHPLFPYAGWPLEGGFVYVYREKYGVGGGLLDLLRLPWDLVFRAETRSFAFLGRVHPAWLLFLPAALVVATRDRAVRVLLAVTVIAGIGWFLGARWMRHLLPVAPLLAVAYGVAMARLPGSVARVAFATWALLLPPQLLDHWERAGEAVPVVTGRQSAEEWLGEEVAGWDAVAFVNRELPEDATVALLFTGETALVERPTLLGSVEDHTPSRHFVWRHGEQSLETLREAGARYAIVGRIRFLRRTYPFLDDRTFEEQLRAPEALLQAELLREATLLYESGRHSVWDLGTAPTALDAPPPRR